MTTFSFKYCLGGRHKPLRRATLSVRVVSAQLHFNSIRRHISISAHIQLSISPFILVCIIIYVLVNYRLNLTSPSVRFSMATLPETIALSSHSNNFRPSLPKAITLYPSLALSGSRRLRPLPLVSGLRIQFPLSASVSSLSSRNRRVLRPSGRIFCEIQESSLYGKFLPPELLYPHLDYGVNGVVRLLNYG